MTNILFILVDFYKGPFFGEMMEHFIRAKPGRAGCHAGTAVSGMRLCGWHGEREKQGKVTRVDNTERA